MSPNEKTPFFPLSDMINLHIVNTGLTYMVKIGIWLFYSFPSYVWFLTFSSPLATLKASSTTLPAAMRDAVEVCDSFQVVSLSTCKLTDE